MNSCNICNNPLVNTIHLPCQGECGHSFHISCLTMTNEHIKTDIITLLINIPGLSWTCNQCVPVGVMLGKMMTMISECVASVNQLKMEFNAGKSSPKPIIDDISILENSVSMLTIADGIVSSGGNNNNNNSNVNKNDNMDTTYVNVAPPSIPPAQPNPFSVKPANEKLKKTIAGKRRLVDTTVSNIFDSTNGKKMRANDLFSSNNNKNKNNRPAADLPSICALVNDNIERNRFKRSNRHPAIAIEQPTRDIYVSPFNPDTEPDDIIACLKNKSNTRHFADNIKCSKLVQQFRDPFSYNFVSFKLTVPAKYYDRMVSSSVWPKQITAKEFQPKYQFNLSKPSTSHSKNLVRQSTLGSLVYVSNQQRQQPQWIHNKRQHTGIQFINHRNRRYHSHQMSHC